MARRRGRARRRRRGYGRRLAAGARRAYRRSRGRGRRAPFRMGLTGKAGTALAGGGPGAVAAVDAMDPWMSATYANASISDKLRLSIPGATNNLTTGFGLGAALPTTFGALPVPNSMAAASGGYLTATPAGAGLGGG